MRFAAVVAVAAAGISLVGMSDQNQAAPVQELAVSHNNNSPDAIVRRNGERLFEEGRRTFRFDTFGDEAFWGDTLKLHLAIEGERFGGVGAGVSPATALAVGLKVDADALSPSVLNGIRHGRVDVND